MTNIRKATLIISFLLTISVNSSLLSPRLISSEKELTLLKSHSLNLCCQGIGKMLWNVTTHQNSNEPKTNCSSSSAGNYLCNLVISQLRYEDSGNYSCSYAEYPGKTSDSVNLQVIGGPENLKIDPLDLDIFRVNHSYTINCTVDAFPFPDIKWEKAVQKTLSDSPTFEELSDVDITNNEEWIATETIGFFTSRSTIKFRAVESVRYRCTAQNEHGVMTATKDVIVSDASDKITVDKSMNRVPEGSDVSLTCFANKYLYDADLVWTWKPDNVIVPLFMNDNKDHTEDETDYSYISKITITSIKSEEAGFYFCEAKNSGKNITSKKAGYILVERFHRGLLMARNFIPNFQFISPQKLESKVLKIHTNSDNEKNVFSKGQNIQLICDGGEKVFWTTPKQPKNRSSDELLINDAVFSDSGIYECADLKMSHIPAKIVVQVEGRPQFIESHPSKKPADILCRINRTCTVTCIAEGNPKPEIHWEKIDCNSTADCDKEFTPFVGNISTLNKTAAYTTQSTISFISGPSISSVYRCVVNNKHGNITQNQTVVTLDHEEMLTIESTNSGHLYEKQNLTVHCKASRYYYDKIIWKKNYTNINTDNFKIYDSISDRFISSELFKSSITGADSNTYTCEAIRDQTSNSINIAIKVEKGSKPEINGTNMNGTTWNVNLSDRVDLYCFTNGKPPPNISWRHKSETVRNSSRIWISQNSTNLTISSVTSEDEGEYEYTATNIEGEVKINVILQVNNGKIPVLAVVLPIVAVLCLIGIIVVYYYFKGYKSKNRNKRNDSKSNDETELKPLKHKKSGVP